MDAYAKNLTSKLDWNLALEAIINDVENEPLEWSYHGRGGLASWKKLSYIPYLDFDPNGFQVRILGALSGPWSTPTTISAWRHSPRGLGKTDLHDKYLARSTNWQNLWRSDQKSVIHGHDTGFTRFLSTKIPQRYLGFAGSDYLLLPGWLL